MINTETSGATPRYAERYPLGRRQTQAVRPRVDERRKGMLTKRGNAHQERGQGRQGRLIRSIFGVI